MAGDRNKRSETKAESAVPGGRPVEEAPASEATRSSVEGQSCAEAGVDRQARSASLDGTPAKAPLASLFLSAAVILGGAGVAVGGAFGLLYFKQAESAALERDMRIEALSERLDSFEKKADASETSERSELTGVESRIDEVESATNKTAAESNSALRDVEVALTELVRTPSRASDEIADIGPLQTRVEAVEQKLASVDSDLARAPDEAAGLKPLETRVDALEKKLSAIEAELASAPVRTPDAVVDLGTAQTRIDALEKKVASVETELARPPAGASEAAVDLGPLQARMDAVEKKLGSLETEPVRMSGGEPDQAEGLAPLQSRIDALEQKIAALEAEPVHAPAGGPDETNDLGPLQTRMDGLESKLASVETELSASKAAVSAQNDQAVRAQSVAIAAEGLLRRLDRGVPFPAEFATLEALGGGQAELAPLRPFAATGVASPRELEEQFSILASQVASGESAREQKSLLARLTSEAARLVHIRRVGDVDADDTDAPLLVAQIEKALARLDIEDAYNIWTELPDGAKARSESWGQSAKARLDALHAARSLEADAVAALGKPKS